MTASSREMSTVVPFNKAMTASSREMSTVVPFYKAMTASSREMSTVVSPFIRPLPPKATSLITPDFRCTEIQIY